MNKQTMIGAGLIAAAAALYLIQNSAGLPGGGSAGTDTGGGSAVSTPGGGQAPITVNIDAPANPFSPDVIPTDQSKKEAAITPSAPTISPNDAPLASPADYISDTKGVGLNRQDYSPDYWTASSKKETTAAPTPWYDVFTPMYNFFSGSKNTDQPNSAPANNIAFGGGGAGGRTGNAVTVNKAPISSTAAAPVSKKQTTISSSGGYNMNFSSQGGGNYTGRSPAGKPAATVYGSIGHKNT